MRLLLTNDDGIHAEGLYVLKKELSKIAECIVVAPEREQSVVGHAITLSRPLMVKDIRKSGIFFGYAVAGTPADCIKIGIKELVGKPVDFIVSGINLGANVGVNVIYSGTVSAATEGLIMGIPSMAISLDTRDKNADFTVAAKVARKLINVMPKMLKFKNMILNVNVPAIPEDQITGVAVTKQGFARFVETFEKRIDPRNNIYYWLAGETLIPEMEDENSDICMLKKGMISITPIHYDLTRHDVLDDLGAYIKDFYPGEI